MGRRLPLTTGEAEACAVAIVDDTGLSASCKLAAALDRAGLWGVLEHAQQGRSPEHVSIVIKPELSGFSVDSPTVTDPALVEALIDSLHDRSYTNVIVVGAADSSVLWAENRDLYALSDLLGYRYATTGGRTYDIVDLSDSPDASVFPLASVLHGSTISRIWLDADIRIVFSKCRTDEIAGYALCLDTLIGVLPLLDKDLHYRNRRHPGDVVAALLDVAPVQFCLIDAIVAAHGPGAQRAPAAIATGTIIAASDIVLADHAGAQKMGLDPEISPTFAHVLRAHALPQRYIVAGSLRQFPDWENVPAFALQASRLRSRSEGLARLVEPWVQRLDPALFPLKHPLDARLNAFLAEYLAESSPTHQWLLTLVNALIGWIGEAIESYRVMFDKDALRRRAVPLGIDLTTVPESAFDALVEELSRLEPIAAASPAASAELAWQSMKDAVVFRYARELPIPFELFVRRVDIARTIQFMNDYIGGVIIAVAQDAAGRPIRQAERNIYLPQPNYLALYQGKPIDVSKLEVVEYAANRHRLYWKTILSENQSAASDDGIATFERTDEGTRVTIIGQQEFTLPPFWQVFDPKFVPGLKEKLVAHAYQTFFDRTLANFEALVEGRDIRIGKAIDEPAPAAAEALMPLLRHAAEIAMPLMQRIAGKTDDPAGDGKRQLDADGFVHITPGQPAASGTEAGLDLSAELERFISGLTQAAQRDLVQGYKTR